MALDPVRFAKDLFQAIRAVAHGFRGEKISLRAAALTYISILSLVPSLAVVLAITRAIGAEEIKSKLHDFIFANLAPGTRESSAAFLEEAINRASSGALGGVGGFFLLASAVSLFVNIERSLNEIWGVETPRPMMHRVAIFWCLLTLGPLLLGGSLLATGALRAALLGARVPVAHGVLTALPAIFTLAGFTLIYLLGPNAHVKLRAALAGGVVAGMAFELAKHGYAIYAARSIRYNAIYGSLSAIPLFLVWVYLSWLLLLFGARLSYALQNANRASPRALQSDARARLAAAARISLRSATAFIGGEPAPTARALARDLRLDERAVRSLLDALKHAALLAEVEGGGVVPARAPDQVSLADIGRAIGGSSTQVTPGAEARENDALAQALEEAEAAGVRALEGRDLLSLAKLAKV